MWAADVLRQALLWQLDRFVPYEALIDVLWGGRPDGGPLYARGGIRRHVHFLRKRGDVIENWHGVGVRMREKRNAAYHDQQL